MLVATHDEEDTVSIRCTHEKCATNIKIQYNPRTIVHINEKHVTDDDTKAYSVPYGEEAKKHFEKVSHSCKRYTLPSTGYIVEVKSPSVYDYLNNVLPLITSLYDRFRPGQSLSTFDPTDQRLLEYQLLVAVATFVSSISIPVGDKEYKYSKWDDIEEIVKNGLDMRDSSLICRLAEKEKIISSPVEFYIEGVEIGRAHV